MLHAADLRKTSHISLINLKSWRTDDAAVADLLTKCACPATSDLCTSLWRCCPCGDSCPLLLGSGSLHSRCEVTRYGRQAEVSAVMTGHPTSSEFSFALPHGFRLLVP